jgi:KaiB domain
MKRTKALADPKTLRKSSTGIRGLDEIVVAPTLVRQLPLPVRRMIGDLSRTERVLKAMDLPPAPHSP